MVGNGDNTDTLNVSREISLLGQLSSDEVRREMLAAEFLIVPSIWHETFGMVIASNLGAMAEIVDDGVTGLLFEAGNAEELGEKVEWAIAHPDEMREMGKNARIEFERKYTAESNLTQLITIYRDAINLCEHEARVNE